MEQELLNMAGSPDAKESSLLEAPPVVKNLSGKKRRFMLPCGDKPIEGKREDSPEAGAGFGQPPELRLEDDEATAPVDVNVKKAGKPPIAPRCKRTARFVEPVVQVSMFERELSLWQETPAAEVRELVERELSLLQDTPAAEDSEAMLAGGACVRQPVKRELYMDADTWNFDGVELPELMRLDEM